ncbi:MAG: NAD(P)-binding domain-containing protein [Pirellulales bacterium]|nr:NAD(P)-binding domain-containing protein [Pirellulales bacterium]
MPDDSLPRIAILGAGPIGLEATLYARYLGYPVQLIERGRSPATNVLQWGHVQLFTPFGMNASPLGVAALQAQDPNWQAPGADAMLTGTEYHQRYLRPLAESDLLASALECNTEILAVGRKDWLKYEGVGEDERGQSPFTLLLRTTAGEERVAEADVVIDCTGTYGNHNWLGQGGIPAPGELAAARHIEYALPDVLGSSKEHYQAKRVLVVGAGYSAATTIVQLVSLGTETTWVTRTSPESAPIKRIPNDRLASRDALAVEATRLAAAPNGPVTHYPHTSITAVEYRSATDDFKVTFAGEHVGRKVFDRIVANVGYRPDNRIYSELQVHECYATGGPMKLAAQLLRGITNGRTDCLDQVSCGPQSLVNPERSFYILGSKSYGRGSQFLLSVGLEQIREVFTIIGQRADLDIYATMPSG